MTATSVSFSPKVASDWDPQKPLTTTKLNQLFDNTTNLSERLSGSYTNNTKDHSHNGVDSASIPVGANSLRNGSFEGNSTAGWTLTPYTGGTLAPSATVYMHGIYSLAITSTVLANGGGDAVTAEYEEVTGNGQYALKGSLKASVANVSSKVEVIWYDNAKAQISAYSVYSSINTPTTQTDFDSTFYAPATAKYKRLKLTGGVPATGTAFGTIYFDGLYAIRPAGQEAAGVVIYTAASTAPEGYLKANGAAISRLAYAGLFAAIGTTCGAGDGSTTFNLPDLRGEFIRSFDDGRGLDSGRTLVSVQSASSSSHAHTIYAVTSGTPSTSDAAGTQDNPRNFSLLACIKY